MIKIVGEDLKAMKQVTCRNCASILVYTRDEVKKYIGKDYSGCPDGREWIVCPSCGGDVVLRSW